MSHTMKGLFSILILIALGKSAIAADYCAAIRGNGELVPSHWSAMARIVEEKGFPKALAGGSSATITQFFMDAISRDQSLNSKEQALALKSIVHHIQFVLDQDAQAPAAAQVLAALTGIDNLNEIIKELIKQARNKPELVKALAKYGKILNPNILKSLKKDFEFGKAQLQEALKVFGAFDAKNDQNILYREGLINFKFLALVLGRIADFYAGNASIPVNQEIKNWMAACADLSFGLSWPNTVSKYPQCAQKLEQALALYYSAKDEKSFPNIMVFQKIGSGVKAYPTTSLIIGDAVNRYNEQTLRYQKSAAKEFEQIQVDFESELAFGYWGDTEGLKKIEQELPKAFPYDAKSSKFLPLFDGTWFEALATSPAEPGLANLQSIPMGPNAQRQGMLSAGGWSDLHPLLVLKANDCNEILYLTRQGGDSVFAQQMFIRLTGATRTISFWRDIAQNNASGWGPLSRAAETSPWNSIYNLGNPLSSFNTSLDQADLVYCTNWDKFKVLKGELIPLIEHAYNAPMLNREQRASMQEQLPGCGI